MTVYQTQLLGRETVANGTMAFHDALPIDSPVEIDGRPGSLTLHNDTARSSVFIAGGTGITPFVSTLFQRRARCMTTSTASSSTATEAEASVAP